jgi:putative ABC transport system ATP-binding protein
MTAPASDPAVTPAPRAGLDAAAIPPDPSPGTDVVVSAAGVWKLFEVGDEIVRAVVDVSFTGRKGEFVALMGPSGSGKSTMLYLMGGLDRPTKGEITINGQPTTGLTEAQFAHMRHSTIGFVFQSFNLIPFLTAVENVELPLMFEPVERASVRRRATDLLERVGLGHRLNHRPSRMSGGEQQRTAIARALIGSPALVLADEPTASLDRETGKAVTAMLRELCKDLGVTVVAATHDPTVADQADRVLRMSSGQVVSQG